ncbi:uncharacterized protein FOMMEDRAFT_150451 [Fomitiporia mediterranea MF3/22]|uniref:uncharacterized protein n=1 Tax=Fomitiporia mediterranea (strain MF3/22) TaxID=694068 RepID=UPI00044086AE|nr:uncharacterized protein FOMMEDRAFT_150451 [Fomitiporia mediterranea MF3/22]EJD07868.1 hypothetical protein FOMMEDRAFT_150451 [Fomitiporia mediterranea MF3/22]
MPNDFSNNFTHSSTSRCAAQAIIDEHTLATMSMPTPRAFTFLCAELDTISNSGSSGHCSPLLSRFIAPLMERRGQSMHCACTDTALLAAQISSFNAPNLNPVNLTTCLTSTRYTRATRLAGTERQPRRGDEGYINQLENAFILPLRILPAKLKDGSWFVYYPI